MRILQIDKFFYNRGGSSKIFFDTIEGLRRSGNEVAEFSMKDSKNFPSVFEKYFISPLPELKSKMDLKTQWNVFKHLFKSREVEKNLTALIKDFKPEVAHIHNAYHHLSASSFLTLKKHKIPTVLTLHDVFPLCPNHSLLNGETMGEELFKNKFYNCIKYKCIDNKLLPSIAGTLEAYFYKFERIWDSIDLFICPSQFMADKMVEYGFPISKMRVIPNPYKTPKNILPLGTKIVYLGRLHHEKGIKIFLEATKDLREYPIVIAGNGPEEKWVNDFISKNRLNNIERVGWVSGDTWKRVMNEAKVIVVPSVFFENCSLTVLEALGNSRIVVASDRGGNPELVQNGKTGFLCKPEDSVDLARAIKLAINLPQAEAETMISLGRGLLRKNHDEVKYFDGIMKTYFEVLKQNDR